MKILVATATALALMAGTGAATAQNTSAGAEMKAGSTSGKTYVSSRRHKHRYTTGIQTRDNNASASGSLLPGKDKLNSKAYIADH